MIIKAWIDSGANIHSKKEIEIEVEKEEWDEMSEEQREELVKENVFQYLDWGWEEA